ncbi:hypothetical protein BS78_05G144700 [Paspalum vaginatum]|nr:hypothetical protein BS78_05G144700 [Paspalum vaginatum]
MSTPVHGNGHKIRDCAFTACSLSNLGISPVICLCHFASERKPFRISSFLEMIKTMRDLLGILIVAGVTAACCVLLLQPAPPRPCMVLPAEQEPALLGNGTLADDPIMEEKLDNSTVSTDDDLPELLRRAAMDDKTVIMSITNEAWTAPGSLLDLFLESFRVGVRTATLLKHLLIVAIDPKAYEQCQRVHPLCYRLRVADGVNYAVEQVFMQNDYVDLMWRRNRFQARVLKLGYSFVFTDMDIIWLRNPLLRIPVGADMAMACDWYYGENPYDLDKTANGGFVYAKASARMAAFYRSWYESRKEYPGEHEQHVFDRVKHTLSVRHDVRVQFVDTAYLSGFCELRKDFYKVCTVHANCMVGLKNKVEKLTGVLDEWKQFREKAAMLGNTTALTD